MPFDQSAYGFWFLLRHDSPRLCIEASSGRAWTPNDGETSLPEALAVLSGRSSVRSSQEGLRIRIHRGAHEIGGNCVELEAEGKRIVLDIGRPLSALRGEVIPLPNISGFRSHDPSLLAVIISHGHQDHWGLESQLPDTIPVFMGEAAARILKEAAFFTEGISRLPEGKLVHRGTFELDPFTITPYLNDHSGYDAYSLLIEAAGKRLFYSGDLQGHGRKGKIFKELLRRPPEDVDVMLMEGTHVVAKGSPAKSESTEKDVEEDIVGTIKKTTGLVLAHYSAQNIDRMVTFYKAAKRTGRVFVVDLYGASVATATGNPNIPHPGEDWPVKVYVPLRQSIRIKETEQFERVEKIKPFRIFPEQICKEPHRYVLTFRGSMAYEKKGVDCFGGARAIWSLWPGYLPTSQGLTNFWSEKNIPYVVHHASGHAHIKDLKRLAEAVSAKRVVPIHSASPDLFPALFENVELHADGKWFHA